MDLKQALKSAGLSQSQLSRMTGINLRQIQKMCAGEYKMENITGRNLLLIADALKVDPHVLVDLDPPE